MSITENDINEIREIKASIKSAEKSLDRFMDCDLSDTTARKEMRDILASITEMEVKLSNKLASLEK